MHQLLAEKEINVWYIPTENQVADVFTKELTSERLAMMFLGIPSKAEIMCYVPVKEH